MSKQLGLSIGAMNLVAAPVDSAPVIQRAVWPPRSDQHAHVLTGFVERVGDPVPMVTADGSGYLGEQLLTQALEALLRSVGPPRALQLVGAVPAHWSATAVEALADATAKSAVLSLGGRPMRLVGDAAASLTAMQVDPGLPSRGIVALCDFGATGTSITLADSAAAFRRVGLTVRYQDFSGNLIDQLVLRQVIGNLDVDSTETTAVAAFSQLRNQCRIAKEELSFDTAARLTGPLPGGHAAVRLTRGELEALIRRPLDGVIAALEATLNRNGLVRADLSAVATVGGGARIPLVTQRISQAIRVPVITTSSPHTVAAHGAALTDIAQDSTATMFAVGLFAGTGVGETTAHPVSAEPAVQALAWSEDLTPDGDADDTASARPEIQFEQRDYDTFEATTTLPWYRRAGFLFSAAAIAAVLAVAGLIMTRTVGGVTPTPVGTTVTTSPSVTAPPPPASLQAPPRAPAPETVVVHQQAPSGAPRQQGPAPRVVPPPQQVSPAPSTAVVTSTTVVTSTATPTTSQCAPPDCITVPEPDPENCGVTGDCGDTTTDPVIPQPVPDIVNCGYTGDCGPESTGGSGPSTPGTGGDPVTELCPADLPDGAVC